MTSSDADTTPPSVNGVTTKPPLAADPRDYQKLSTSSLKRSPPAGAFDPLYSDDYPCKRVKTGSGVVLPLQSSNPLVIELISNLTAEAVAQAEREAKRNAERDAECEAARKSSEDGFRARIEELESLVNSIRQSTAEQERQRSEEQERRRGAVINEAYMQCQEKLRNSGWLTKEEATQERKDFEVAMSAIIRERDDAVAQRNKLESEKTDVDMHREEESEAEIQQLKMEREALKVEKSNSDREKQRLQDALDDQAPEVDMCAGENEKNLEADVVRLSNECQRLESCLKNTTEIDEKKLNELTSQNDQLREYSQTLEASLKATQSQLKYATTVTPEKSVSETGPGATLESHSDTTSPQQQTGLPAPPDEHLARNLPTAPYKLKLRYPPIVLETGPGTTLESQSDTTSSQQQTGLPAPPDEHLARNLPTAPRKLKLKLKNPLKNEAVKRNAVPTCLQRRRQQVASPRPPRRKRTRPFRPSRLVPMRNPAWTRRLSQWLAIKSAPPKSRKKKLADAFDEAMNGPKEQRKAAQQAYFQRLTDLGEKKRYGEVSESDLNRMIWNRDHDLAIYFPARDGKAYTMIQTEHQDIYNIGTCRTLPVELQRNFKQRAFIFLCVLARMAELQVEAAATFLSQKELDDWKCRTFGIDNDVSTPVLKDTNLDAWQFLVEELSASQKFQNTCRYWVADEPCSDKDKPCWPPQFLDPVVQSYCASWGSEEEKEQYEASKKKSKKMQAKEDEEDDEDLTEAMKASLST